MFDAIVEFYREPSCMVGFDLYQPSGSLIGLTAVGVGLLVFLVWWLRRGTRHERDTLHVRHEDP
ncbi:MULTISPECIES: hypothetical protein [unclassified Corallococcus]|uniref:hypothetical protein n=1 Tax=unclassified Corallococcus TaxID=2685029 RepID=UPI001A8F22AF|nr:MULTISPECIES: hypothetical protein [unclassified Corallococcus]MBN9684861.1 hypothetical protein [Corallococcus sp. NCSPR001]WAS83675.1 hypothetical protein O0N60_30730 [Corallococcus sp. NCRR]